MLSQYFPAHSRHSGGGNHGVLGKRYQGLGERVGPGTVHLELGEYREPHVELQLAELADFRVTARVMVGEPVAGKADYRAPLCGIFFVQLPDAFEPRRQAAFAGGVDQKQHFSAVIPERFFSPFEAAHWKSSIVVITGLHDE